MFPVWNDASTWNLAPLAPSAGGSSTPLGHRAPLRHRPASVCGLAAGRLEGRKQPDAESRRAVRHGHNSHAREDDAHAVAARQPAHDKNNVAPRLGARATRSTIGRPCAAATGCSSRSPPTTACSRRKDDPPVREPDLQQRRVPTSRPSSDRALAAKCNGGRSRPVDQALQNACDSTGRKPGCVRRSLTQEINYPGRQTPTATRRRSGCSARLRTDMSLEVNYVYTRDATRGNRTIKVNLTYNPATGANYPFTDISHRPFPDGASCVRVAWRAGRTTTALISRSPSGSATAGRHGDLHAGRASRTPIRARDQWYIGSGRNGGAPADRLPARSRW